MTKEDIYLKYHLFQNTTFYYMRNPRVDLR